MASGEALPAAVFEEGVDRMMDMFLFGAEMELCDPSEATDDPEDPVIQAVEAYNLFITVYNPSEQQCETMAAEAGVRLAGLEQTSRRGQDDEEI
jgi:hypothetical protein